MGKYLAACYLLPFIERPRDEMQIDLITLSKESRWFTVFCFTIARINSRSILNHFLKELLSNQNPLSFLLVAYAIDAKPLEFIGDDVRNGYISKKVQVDLDSVLAA
jgi:hypothetical protein